MDRSPLAQVKSLAQADRFNEAIELCAKLLSEEKVDLNEVYRARAFVYSLAGNYAKASEDRESVLKSGQASLRDQYQAAEAALKAREIDLAATRFLETIERGKAEQEGWFHSAALFYLAFLDMERESFDSAIKYVEQVKQLDGNCELPIPGVGVVSIATLEMEILKRRRQ